MWKAPNGRGRGHGDGEIKQIGGHMKMSMEYPRVYFEKDGKCRKFSDDTVISYCVMGPCSEQKLSNADRIRDMSDEELAKWMDNFFWGHKKANLFNLLDWLRQPAEEDAC